MVLSSVILDSIPCTCFFSFDNFISQTRPCWTSSLYFFLHWSLPKLSIYSTLIPSFFAVLMVSFTLETIFAGMFNIVWASNLFTTDKHTLSMDFFTRVSWTNKCHTPLQKTFYLSDFNSSKMLSKFARNGWWQYQKSDQQPSFEWLVF